MGIRINSVDWEAEHWVADLQVYEGVYRKDHYPVWIVDVPAPPVGWDEQRKREHLSRFVLDSVREHMRSGALPPNGIRLQGEKVWVTKPQNPTL